MAIADWLDGGGRVEAARMDRGDSVSLAGFLLLLVWVTMDR